MNAEALVERLAAAAWVAYTGDDPAEFAALHPYEAARWRTVAHSALDNVQVCPNPVAHVQVRRP